MVRTAHSWWLCRPPGSVAARGVRRAALVLTGLGALLAMAQGIPPIAAGVRAATTAGSSPATQPLAEIAGASAPGPASAPDLSLRPEIRARCEVAQARLEAHEVERAAADLEAALNSEGGSCYEVSYLLARVKLALGRAGEARLAAEHAAVYRPGAADVHLLLGRLHRRQHRTELGIAHLRSATLAAEHEARNPNVTLAWFELGDLLAENGYLTAAAEAFARFDRAVWVEHSEQRRHDEVAALLEQHPYGAIERRLDLLRRLGHTADLVEAAEGAFRTRPDELYLERLYVRTLVDAGQTGAAFDYCRQRLESGRQHPASAAAAGPRESALFTLAIEAGRADGQLAHWVTELSRPALAGPGRELAERLAPRLDEAQQYDLSIRLWRALAEAQPAAAGVAWSLASALRSAGDLPGALDSLVAFVRRTAADSATGGTDAAEIPPERLATWMRSFAATDEFLRLVKSFTDRADCDFATYTVLATTAAAAGQTELAERLFRAALDARPQFALAHIGWGRMRLSTFDWEDALSHAEQALASCPHSCAAQSLLAEAYNGLDDYEPAEQAYKAATEGCPDQASYALAMGRYYRRAGNALAAQRYFQRTWSLGHTSADAVEELVDSYLEGGKVEVARAVIQEAEASAVPDDALRRMRTAVRFAAAPMQAEHLAELQRQVAEFPDDVKTALKLAAGLYVSQLPDDALNVLEPAHARAPDDERILSLLARLRLRRLESDQAVRLLEEMARRYPRRRGVLHLLANAYLAEFRIEEARQTWQRLLALDAGAEQQQALRETLLAAYLDFGDFDAALTVVDGWIRAAPEEPAWQRAKLRTLLRGERFDEALAFARAALEPVTRRFVELRDQYQELNERRRALPAGGGGQSSEDLELAARLENAERELTPVAADLYDRRSDFVQTCLDSRSFNVGEEQVRGWLAEGPNPPQVQEWLIEILLAAQRGSPALDEIAKLVPRTPTDVIKALVWRARALALADRREEALADLNKLLDEGFVQSSAAAVAQVRQEILTLLVGEGEVERADALCARWLAAVAEGDRVGRLSALTQRRYVLQAAGRDEESVALVQELLEVQPHDPGLNNDLGYTWVDRGENVPRALEMIKLAVAAEPLNSAFLDSLGWAYYKLGEFPAAREFLARAVRLRSGQDATVYDHLGDTEYRLGDRGAARQRWERAVDVLQSPRRGSSEPRDTELIARLRGKLTALDGQLPPPVAPTAAESAEPSQGGEVTR